MFLVFFDKIYIFSVVHPFAVYPIIRIHIVYVFCFQLVVDVQRAKQFTNITITFYFNTIEMNTADRTPLPYQFTEYKKNAKRQNTVLGEIENLYSLQRYRFIIA